MEGGQTIGTHVECPTPPDLPSVRTLLVNYRSYGVLGSSPRGGVDLSNGGLNFPTVADGSGCMRWLGLKFVNILAISFYGIVALCGSCILVFVLFVNFNIYFKVIHVWLS